MSSENNIQFDLGEEPSEVSTSPEPKSRYGIAILGFIILLLGSLSLWTYLDKPKSNEKQYPEVHLTLRQVTFLKRAQNSVLQTETKTVRDHSDKEVNKPLDGLISNLVEKKENDFEALALYLVMRREQGITPDDADLARLKNSSKPVHSDLSMLYGKAPISDKEFEKIEERFKKHEFGYRLAIVHAKESRGDKTARSALISNNQVVFMMIGQIALVMIGAFGIILLVIFAANLMTEKVPASKSLFEKISFNAADEIALWSVGLFVIYIAVSAFAEFGLVSQLSEPWQNITVYGVMLLSMLTLSARRMPRTGRSLLGAAFGKVDFVKDTLWGIGAACAAIPIVIVLGILGTWIFSFLPPPEHPITKMVEDRSFINIFSIIFTASFVAPITEELMFRGSMLPALERILNRPYLASLLAGFAFAIIHPTGIPSWFALTALGMLLGYMSRLRGNLYTAMVMHAVYNFILIMSTLAIQ